MFLPTILSGKWNKQDKNYRRLCCLKRAYDDVMFASVKYDNPRFNTQELKDQFWEYQSKATHYIDLMADMILTTDPQVVATPPSKLRERLIVMLAKTEGLKIGNSSWSIDTVISWLKELIAMVEAMEKER